MKIVIDIDNADYHRFINDFANENDANLLESIFKHGTPLSKEHGKWIPVSERLPECRDWYLGIFKESDTGWINTIPFICDYIGCKTAGTTKDYWILRGLTDSDDRIDDYYFNLECVAWMPLPEPYKPESEEKRLTYCSDCIHYKVCGNEGVDDIAMTFCSDKQTDVDLISRKAVKDLIRGLTRWGVRSQDRKFENVGLLYDDVMFGIDNLPSAEKTAEWVYRGNSIICSNCGEKIPYGINNHYCRNCGAKMKESEENK